VCGSGGVGGTGRSGSGRNGSGSDDGAGLGQVQAEGVSSRPGALISHTGGILSELHRLSLRFEINMLVHLVNAF
jgi:hypothetical protein